MILRYYFFRLLNSAAPFFIIILYPFQYAYTMSGCLLNPWEEAKFDRSSKKSFEKFSFECAYLIRKYWRCFQHQVLSLPWWKYLCVKVRRYHVRYEILLLSWTWNSSALIYSPKKTHRNVIMRKNLHLDFFWNLKFHQRCSFCFLLLVFTLLSCL